MFIPEIYERLEHRERLNTLNGLNALNTMNTATQKSVVRYRTQQRRITLEILTSVNDAAKVQLFSYMVAITLTIFRGWFLAVSIMMLVSPMCDQMAAVRTLHADCVRIPF